MASTTDINNFLSYILYSQSIYMDKVNLRERLGHTDLFMWRLRVTILNNYVQMLMDYFPLEPEYGLLTSWENYLGPNQYETFVTSGANISSIINSAGLGLANSSWFDVVEGETITVEMTVTLTSGTIPTLYMAEESDSIEAPVLVEGLNVIEFVPTWSGASKLQFLNNLTNVNCSITGVSVYRKPRRISNTLNNFMTIEEAQEVIDRINRMCDSNYVIEL